MAAQNLISNSENAPAWSQLSFVTAVLAPSVAAPDGSLGKVSLITATGGGVQTHLAEQTNAFMPYFAVGLGAAAYVLNLGREHWSGAWLKAGTTTKVVLGNGRHSSWFRALFNLALGTVDTEENCRAYIEPGPDGWFYCGVVYTTPVTELNPAQDSVTMTPAPAAQTGTATVAFTAAGETCYIWGAQLALTNGPPPYQKTTTQTVEGRAPRARNCRGNNLRWSEAPSNVVWTKYLGTCAPSAEPSPIGGLAEAFTENNSLGFHGISQAGTADKGIYTITAFVKAGTRSWCVLATAGTGVGAYFDLTNGVTGTIFGSPIAVSIESAGNGWWCISLSHSVPAAVRALELYAAPSNGGANYTGTNGAIAFYVAGMSLVQSWGPSEHTPTNTPANVPINPKIGLRGRAMQNLLTSDSEDATTWFTPGGVVTVTGNAAEAPTGAMLADRVQWTAGASRYCSPSGQVFKRGVYTISMWVRAVTGTSQFQFRLPNLPGVNNQDSGNFTATTTWQRFSFTAQVNGDGTFTSVYFLNDNVQAGDFYVWGMQLTQTAGEAPYVKSTTQAVQGRAPRRLLGKQNLLLASQTIWSDAIWSQSNLTSRTASPALAPDGTLTVSRMEDANAGLYGLFQQSITIPPGSRSYCFSIYVRKASTSPVCGWNYVATGGTTAPSSFRVSPATGAWSSGGGPGGVEDCGDYWRVWSVVRNQGSSSLRIDFYPATGTSFAGGDTVAGVGWIDVWGAQWTEGEGPTEYVATTTTPVNTGAPRRRMPRQNIGPNSDMLTGAWTISSATRSAGPLGPTGKASILVLEDSTPAAVHYLNLSSATMGGNRICSLTYYAKRATAGSRQWIACAGNGGNAALWFDLINGVRMNNGGPNSGTVGSSIEPAGNGWWKISISWIQTPGLEIVRIYMADAEGSVTFNGDGGASGGIYLADAHITESYGPPGEMIDTRNTPAGSQAQEYDRAPRGLWAA